MNARMKTFVLEVQKYNINFDTNFSLDEFKYDFKIGNCLVDIQCTGKHNLFYVPLSNPITKDFFIKKRSKALYYNYNYKVLWEWDDIAKFVNFFIPKTKIRGNECVIKTIENSLCKEFLNKYHMQGNCKAQTVRYGLFHKGELVEVMTFGKPRYNHNYQWELLRLCSKSDVIVYGGSTKLFNYFVSEYCPQSVISYCDCSKFSGKVYEQLGMKNKNNPPSIHWVKLKPLTHLTDNLVRQKGVDKLLGTNFGKGTSNEEILKTLGFLTVPDCGQTTFTKVFSTL